jgi:hypothetical protein
MHGALSALAENANLRGGINATKNIQVADQRISFRSLALLAWPRKTAFELTTRTGANERTCKRWLAGEGALPWSAVSVVLQEIIRRLN